MTGEMPLDGGRPHDGQDDAGHGLDGQVVGDQEFEGQGGEDRIPERQVPHDQALGDRHDATANDMVGSADPADASVADLDMKRALEALVLVAHEPVAPELLAQLLERSRETIEQWCDQLAAEYHQRGSGFELVKVAGGYRYQTCSDLTAYVERFLLYDQRARLSGAALETLAVVAYKQPISRAQIASIRGVDPDGVLRTLTARGYVDQVGRDDGPGQAILFGTTSLFLEKLGLDSLDDLPPIADFIPGADVVEALEVGLGGGSGTEACGNGSVPGSPA